MENFSFSRDSIRKAKQIFGTLYEGDIISLDMYDFDFLKDEWDNYCFEWMKNNSHLAEDWANEQLNNENNYWNKFGVSFYFEDTSYGSYGLYFDTPVGPLETNVFEQSSEGAVIDRLDSWKEELEGELGVALGESGLPFSVSDFGDESFDDFYMHGLDDAFVHVNLIQLYEVIENLFDEKDINRLINNHTDIGSKEELLEAWPEFYEFLNEFKIDPSKIDILN